MKTCLSRMNSYADTLRLFGVKAQAEGLTNKEMSLCCDTWGRADFEAAIKAESIKAYMVERRKPGSRKAAMQSAKTLPYSLTFLENGRNG